MCSQDIQWLIGCSKCNNLYYLKDSAVTENLAASKSLEIKAKFDTIIHHMGGLFNLVHMDISRPTKTALLGGHRYFVSFVDDFSMHCWVYPMRQTVGYTQ